MSLLRSYGRQAVMVTHSRDEAYHLCTRLCIMEDGRILRAGGTKEVFAAPGSEAAARLTGCKNISRAVKAGAYTVEALDWGVCLTAAQPVPDNLKAVGLRAHAFHPQVPSNRLPVLWADALEEPFEWILLFRYQSQAASAPALWWRFPKDRKPAALPDSLGIAPEHVLLLT